MTKARAGFVERPYRRSDHRIVFASKDAEKGWRDLVATAQNAAATAWEFLTAKPAQRDDSTCYPLKDDLGTVTIDGTAHTRWQYKPTSGGRIWYAVVPAAKGEKFGIVYLERVMTGHPNETVKNFR